MIKQNHESIYFRQDNDLLTSALPRKYDKDKKKLRTHGTLFRHTAKIVV